MRRAVLWVAVAGCLAVAGEAAAQGFGIGPRVSFVRGNELTDEPSSRLLGGAMRMGSKHVALELSLDYRSIRELGSTTRVREMPLQGSLLIYPVRTVFAPYLLGGVGVYNRMLDQLDPDGEVIVTASERKFGVHLGLGAEIKLHTPPGDLWRLPLSLRPLRHTGGERSTDHHSRQRAHSRPRQVQGVARGIDVDGGDRVLLLTLG